MVFFADSFREALDISIKRYQNFLVPILLDVALFILYGAVMGGVFTKAMFYLVQAGYTALSLFSNEPNMSLFDILFSFEETRMLMVKISFLLIMTISLLFFVYSFTQGIAWAKARDILSKTKIKKYLHVFFRVNLFWFGIFIFYKIILLFIRLGEVLSSRTVIETKTFGEYVFLLILLYFVFLSYALIKEKTSLLDILKKTFKLGILKSYQLLPCYLIFGIFLLAVHYLLIIISPVIPSHIALILAMVVLLPALTFGRLYLFIQVNKIEK